MSPNTPTVQLASVVYGPGVPLDDPAENFHEASKLYRSFAGRQARGIQLLEQHGDLQASIDRPGRRQAHRPRLHLRPSVSSRTALSRTLLARRSQAPQPRSTLERDDLAALAAAASGTVDGPGTPRRAAPSAGALYPLELYVLALRISDVPRGAYHFDPLDSSLEWIDRPLDRLGDGLVDPTIATDAAAVLVFTGMFWRSRFKYGQRGYRFTLLEAGHAAQNALLAAADRRLDALPLGGFYDHVIDEIVGADGVNESSIYLIAVGREPVDT